jgi:hypothetical protein
MENRTTALILLCLVLLTGPSRASATGRNLTRDYEPVVLTGRELAEFVGTPKGFLFLFAYRGGEWQEIPFQLDKRNSDGRYRYDVPEEQKVLEEVDEFVFMAKDAGDSAPGNWLEKYRTDELRLEIAVGNPLKEDENAWVYLYRIREGGPVSIPHDYVNYFAATSGGADRIRTTYYELSNGSWGFPTELKILATQGGAETDLIDRMYFQAKGSGSVLGINLNFTIDESDISFKSAGNKVDFIDGLIRVVREFQATLTIDAPWPFSDINVPFSVPPAYYYPYSAQVNIDVPNISGASVSEGRVNIELAAPMTGSLFLSANNPLPGFILDLKDDLPNTTIDNQLPKNNWMLVQGNSGTIVHQFPLLPTLGKERRLYYDDNGDLGSIGVLIGGGLQTPFTLSYKGYFLDSKQPNTIGSTLTLNDSNPLTRKVTPQLFSSVPVELIAFSAMAAGRDVLIEWSTASETNNFGFELQSLTNEGDWFLLAFIPGHGTTNEPQTYTYLDASLPAGEYLYRLKQVDLDGQFEYSTTISATIGLPETFTLAQNYPNPFNPETTIEFAIPADSERDGAVTKLVIFNMLGKHVRTLVDEHQMAGFYSVTWDGRNANGLDVPSGVYVYRLVTGTFIASKKMLLIR